MKRCWLLLERIKEQPRAHQRAAESASSRSSNKYTKKSVAHFCNPGFLTIYFCNGLFCVVFLTIYFRNGLFCAQFF